MGFFKNIRERFKNVRVGARYEMVTERGNGFYSWSGNVYKSDIIRAATRPYVKAVGKLVAKHIYDDGKTIKTNPQVYMRFLLEEPNPFMTGQMLQEKVANQLILNNNAFVLIIRDENGLPCELYPINCASAEAVYVNHELYLKFYYTNGKSNMFPYAEIIHLRNDFCENDIFGTSPAPALSEIMEVITTADQSIIKAIKNSSVVRWLLKWATTLRPDDLKENVKSFRDNYLSTESDTFGAAGISGDCDAIQVTPNDYVPNAKQQSDAVNRVYAFFNVSEKIIHSDYDDNEWNAYFEAVVEPTAIQLSGEYTRKLFNRRERGFGNKIIFDASNLSCASLQAKLQLQAMVDRGAMSANEWRATFNLAPVDGGDVIVRRLDTAPTEGGSAENKKAKSAKGGEK